ncbi:3-isopropylmalate dehydratase small subunit (plasmid) [Buchnera aphidicola (Macrosiphoniella sanborni)]|uniref:3-isopropylmalate dehydratase small subunit n=1 Tax=Buchnera aphidicola (Macrosiphoniella sanborni) TaxID=1241865 RepID=A0A4D6YEW1_9GAMM|nr:3-isopropylmalate dehydratase small subunit [Buchnera aphidicola]QCI24120.1 3-isopropylmalate dehydratase small subunit [Buchnera aphidicola (Macrosiphoniella sanborni)]
MLKYIEHTGVIVPLNIANIDTDILIPKQFLKQVNKQGLGKFLFYDWRFMDGNQLLKNEEFILNQKIYQNASILITGENFGCGSSREHAVWSLLDYGFKIIIAPSFSDIFYNNSINNKLLLINLSKKKVSFLFDLINSNPGICAKINFINKQIIINKKIVSFDFDDSQFLFFSSDLDNIDLTMQYLDNIKNYEKNIPDFLIKRKDFKSDC